MAKTSIRVDGLKQLQQNLQGLTKNLRNRLLKSAVIAGAKVVVKAAKADAPVDTGRVRRAIRNLRDKRSSRKDYEVQAVSVFKLPGAGTYGNTRANRRLGRVGQNYDKDSPAFYWKFHELGTVKMAARPFIAPALNKNKQQVTMAMRDKLMTDLLRFNIIR